MATVKGIGRKGTTDKPMGKASAMPNQPVPTTHPRLIVVRVGKYARAKQPKKS
jgi:hypothetical protein